jgi:hypothetical protein
MSYVCPACSKVHMVPGHCFDQPHAENFPYHVPEKKPIAREVPIAGWMEPESGAVISLSQKQTFEAVWVEGERMETKDFTVALGRLIT